MTKTTTKKMSSNNNTCLWEKENQKIATHHKQYHSSHTYMEETQIALKRNKTKWKRFHQALQYFCSVDQLVAEHVSVKPAGVSWYRAVALEQESKQAIKQTNWLRGNKL